MRATSSTALSKRLPEWDLSDLYSAIDDTQLQTDIVALKKHSTAFCKAYKTNVPSLSAEKLGTAIEEYEALQEISGKIGSYAQLLFAKCMTDAKSGQFYQNTQETLTAIASDLLFFTLALNRCDEKEIQEKLKHPRVRKYAPWIRDVRALQPYQLSDELEKMLLEKSVAGAAAWSRLFDETVAALRFPVGQKKLTEAEVFHLLTSKEPQARKKAALSIGDTFKAHAQTFALITNTLAKDKEIEDRWRGFKRPISSRNVANYIEDEVVDALIGSVQESYASLSHRYYKLKAKWFGKRVLEYWDRNAPLPFDADRSYSWDEAQEVVLTSYHNFSPELADTGKLFFDNKWIDAAVTPGKSPGAFAHPTVPSAHPYLLMNFQGRTRDVMTLAHELGHGVHQVMSAKQGALLAGTPLTLAETASVFGEQLTFREMIRREKDERKKKALIAGKVEDMINTVVRQTAFCQFEIRLHDARAKSELTAEQISAIWMDVQAQSLGPAIKLHGNYKYFWTYIPHFIHSPFYVYAYAFGDCLVNSLYAVYEREAEKGKGVDFEKKYLTMLQAGGSLRHKELLAPFGLDASKADFWKKGLNSIAAFIDELEG